MASNDDIEIKEKHKNNPWAQHLKIGSVDSYPWLERQYHTRVGSSSTKLDIKDIGLYGICPLLENVFLVRCQECKRVINVQSAECHESECRNSQETVKTSDNNSEINSAGSNDNKVSHCAQSTTGLLLSVSGPGPGQNLPVNLSIPQTSVKKRLIKSRPKSECKNTQEKVEASDNNSAINSFKQKIDNSSSIVAKSTNKHTIEEISKSSCARNSSKKPKLDVRSYQSNLIASSNEDKVSDSAESTGLLFSISGHEPGQDFLVNSVSQTCGKKGLTKVCPKSECRNSLEKVEACSNNIEMNSFWQKFDNAASIVAKSAIGAVNKHKIQETPKSYSARKSYSKKCKVDISCQSNLSACSKVSRAQSASVLLSVVPGPRQDRDLLTTKAQPQTKSYNPSIDCGVITEYSECCLGKISSSEHRPVSSAELLKQFNTPRSANLETVESCTNFTHQENLQRFPYNLCTEQATSSTVLDSGQDFNSVTQPTTLALAKQRTLDNSPKDSINYNTKANQIPFHSTVDRSQDDTGQYPFYTNHFGSSSNCDMNCDSLRINHSKSKGERKEYSPQPNSSHLSTSSSLYGGTEVSDPSIEQTDQISRTFSNQFIQQFTSNLPTLSNKQQDTESTVSFLHLGSKQPVKSRTPSTICSSKKSYNPSIHYGVTNDGESCIGNISSHENKSTEHRRVHELISSGDLLKQYSAEKNAKTVVSCTNFSNLQQFSDGSYTKQATSSSVPDSGQGFSCVNELATINKQRTLDNSTKDSINCKPKTNQTHLLSTICHSQSDTGQYQFSFTNHSSNCDDMSNSDSSLNYGYKFVPTELHKNNSTSFNQSFNLVSVVSKSKGERKEYSLSPNCLHRSTSSVHYSGPDLSLEQPDQIGRTSQNQIKQVTSDQPNLSNKQDTENTLSLENKQPVKLPTSSSECSFFSNSKEEGSSKNKYDFENSEPFLGDKKESSRLSPVEDSFSKKHFLSNSFSNNGSKETIPTPHVVYCSAASIRGFNPLKRSKFGLILLNHQSDGLRKALERVVLAEKALLQEKQKEMTSQHDIESVKETNSVCRSQNPPPQPVDLSEELLAEKKLLTEDPLQKNSTYNSNSSSNQNVRPLNGKLATKSSIHVLTDNGLTKGNEVNVFKFSAVKRCTAV